MQQFLLTVHKLTIELVVAVLPVFSQGTPKLVLNTPKNIHFTSAYASPG